MIVVYLHTGKKEKKIFLIYKDIQMGAVAKSYMMKDFLIYEEKRKYLVKYEETVSHIRLCSVPFWISLYMRKILFSLYQCSFDMSLGCPTLVLTFWTISIKTIFIILTALSRTKKLQHKSI